MFIINPTYVHLNAIFSENCVHHEVRTSLKYFIIRGEINLHISRSQIIFPVVKTVKHEDETYYKLPILVCLT